MTAKELIEKLEKLEQAEQAEKEEGNPPTNLFGVLLPTDTARRVKQTRPVKSLYSQYRQTKRDMNKRVSKGGDIGLVAYTKSYLLIFFTFIPFMFVVTAWGNIVDTSDPLMGILSTGVVIYLFIKLIKWYDRS